MIQNLSKCITSPTQSVLVAASNGLNENGYARLMKKKGFALQNSQTVYTLVYTRHDMAKLYLKLKIDGKWIWKPAGSPFLDYQARQLCECIRCNIEQKTFGGSR